MLPSEFIVHFGSVMVDKSRQYNYVRMYVSGLTIEEARMLVNAYPDTYIRRYEVVRNPDSCWRWSSGSLSGLGQVIRDLRLSHLLNYDFIECVWTYAYCKARHRGEIGRRIREMINNEPLKLSRILRQKPK